MINNTGKPDLVSHHRPKVPPDEYHLMGYIALFSVFMILLWILDGSMKPRYVIDCFDLFNGRRKRNQCTRHTSVHPDTLQDACNSELHMGSGGFEPTPNDNACSYLTMSTVLAAQQMAAQRQQMANKVYSETSLPTYDEVINTDAKVCEKPTDENLPSYKEAVILMNMGSQGLPDIPTVC